MFGEGGAWEGPGGGGRAPSGACEQVFYDSLLLSHLEMKPSGRADVAASRPGWAQLPSAASNFRFLPLSEL